jgi:hypothetical protein
MSPANLTEDYLIRQINLILAALANAIGLKTASQYIEARLALDEALEELFGLRADLVRQMDDQALMDHLTSLDMLDTDRLQLAADLFNEDGDLHARLGRPETAWASRLRALTLYLEVALHGGAQHLPDPGEKIEDLLRRLEPPEEEGRRLPADTRFLVYCYDDENGRTARAARSLEILAQDPGSREAIQDELQAFRQRHPER